MSTEMNKIADLGESMGGEFHDMAIIETDEITERIVVISFSDESSYLKFKNEVERDIYNIIRVNISSVGNKHFVAVSM